MEDLTKLGLTPSQVKLYLTVLRIGQADGKAIARHSGVARQEVYRVIGELEEKGLIEKIITKPFEFRGVPIQDGLSSLLTQKAKEYELAKKKTISLIKRFQPKKEKIAPGYILKLIPKREALIRKLVNEFNIAQKSIDIITTVQMFMQATDFYAVINEVIKRKIKLRVITEKPCNQQSFLKSLKSLLESGLEIKYLLKNPEADIAIFDRKEAIITLCSAASLSDSTCMWTNHPSLLAIYQDHYDTVWRNSLLYKNDFVSVKGKRPVCLVEG
jgi:sugar-specific transcriptional regulator TrmB